MFDSLYNLFGSLLAFLYGLIPNYGIAIILITIVIRLLLYPLTSRQARSMAKMQKVQPEIKKIQERHKNDRQKLNEELMAFYKEHQINPLAGCLPLLLQFPIFIALFQVLSHPEKRIPLGSDLFTAFCDGHQTARSCADADGFPVGLRFLGMDLSLGANADLGGFLDAIPYFVLIALVIASGYYQSRQMTSLQKGRATPQSQMMTRIFPVFFGVISYTLPAGVVLYFFVSNLWQIGQQAIVFGKEDPARASGKGAPPPKKSLFGDLFKRPEAGPAPAGSKAPRDGGAKAPAVEAEAREVVGDGPAAPIAPGNKTPGTKASGNKTPGTKSPGNGSPPKPKAGATAGPSRPNRSNARKKKKRKKRR